MLSRRRLCAADFAGERKSKGARGYGSQKLTPKGTGEGCGFSPGLLVARDVAQVGRRRGSAAGSVRWPWTGHCGGAPRLLTRREDSSGPCEGVPGVKEALRSTAAGNFLRKGSPAAAPSRAIPAGMASGVGAAARCASGRRGGAKAGRCRGGAAAERRGHVGAEVRHGGAARLRRLRLCEAARGWMGCRGSRGGAN